MRNWTRLGTSIGAHGQRPGAGALVGEGPLRLARTGFYEQPANSYLFLAQTFLLRMRQFGGLTTNSNTVQSDVRPDLIFGKKLRRDKH